MLWSLWQWWEKEDVDKYLPMTKCEWKMCCCVVYYQDYCCSYPQYCLICLNESVQLLQVWTTFIYSGEGVFSACLWSYLCSLCWCRCKFGCPEEQQASAIYSNISVTHLFWSNFCHPKFFFAVYSSRRKLLLFMM